MAIANTGTFSASYSTDEPSDPVPAPSENDPQWQLLKNTVVHGTIEEPDPIGVGPEGIWLTNDPA